MQKRNVLNSPRLLELKKHRQRIVLNKIFFALLGLLAVFGLLAYLSRINSLNISKIEILDSKVADIEAIKSVAAEQITGNYLWLFPKTNILLYPKNSIKNKLQNEFKRLSNINLSVNNNILKISVGERTAKYLWCGETLSEIEIPKCYFVDESGYVFDEAPYFSGEVYFKFYGAQNESYFYKQKFNQLIAFKDALSSFGLKPVILKIIENGDVEISLSKEISSPLDTLPKIIFRLDADFQNVIENLETALNTEPLKSKFKNKYSSLSYIDLRFGNKVYDKFLE